MGKDFVNPYIPNSVPNIKRAREKSAPHYISNHKVDWDGFNDPERRAMSWRAYKRKQK